MRLPRRIPRWLGPAALGLALLGWAALVIRSGRWPAGDGPHVLGAAMRLAAALRAGELGAFGRSLLTLLAPHPPGGYLPWTLAYLVAGPGRWGHLLASAGLLALCADGIRRLGGGAVGVLWLLAPALVWAQAELGGVDLVAAACAAQAVSHLAASERLSRRAHVVAWGAWMGLGFLSKYTFPMFLWAPCALAGVWVVREQRWPRLLEAVLAFAAVAGPWLLWRFDDVLAYVAASTAPDPFLVAARDLARGPWYAWENLSWYPAAALDAWGWPGALALGLGVLGRRRREALPDARALALLAALGGWLVLAQSVQRQDRYLLPMIPLLAALAGASRLRAWGAPVALIGLLGTASVFGGTEAAPPNRDYGHEIGAAGRSWPRPAESYSPVSQDPTLWEVDRALKGLYALHGREDGTVGLLLDDGRGAPGMGLYLFRAVSLGYRWDLATVSLAQEGPETRSMVFVGPFATEEWPSREFSAIYAAFQPGDALREGWLASEGADERERWALPMAQQGALYTLGR